jgi:glucosyltransferase
MTINKSEKRPHMPDIHKDLISLVVPCYNEQEAINFFYKEVCAVSSEMTADFEYIFVDDGSKDATLDAMRELAQNDERVHYLSFSRNFGKEAAMLAGLEAAKGDYVAVMDVDLQDPPEMLKEMYAAVKTGEYDCAAARRVTRDGEPPIRSFFARAFYRLINKISKTEIVDGARDFRLMTKRMVQAIISVKEYNRFSKGIFGWVGFKTKWLEYVNVERVAGETKWSFWKLFVYSIDGITAFSTVPLSISAFAGVLFCFLAFFMLIFVIVRAAIWGDPVSGWPSLVCIILLVSGVQLFSIGVLGQYLSKTYLEVKQRPQYIVAEQK